MSTKPYLYFEQIMNGIVSIPESVQDKLKNVMLVRQEELQKQKETPTEESGLLSWFKPKEEEQTKEEPYEGESIISTWFTKPEEISTNKDKQIIEEENTIKKCNIRGW
jgi:hypothetical protein